MERKVLQLRPLADIGSGSAEITDTEVKIHTTGINGVLKAWLIGGEAECIGNIVDGSLCKKANTAAHEGVLVTQSGRQMLIGFYGENASDIQSDTPFHIGGYKWKKVCGKSFADESDAVKYILSNRSVYACFKKYGHYFIGTGKKGSAIALPCKNGDENPLWFLGNTNILLDGYRIVCVDDENQKIFLPEIS